MYDWGYPTLGRRVTTVTYRPDPLAGGTRVTVTHEGFVGLRKPADEHVAGWEGFLSWLEAYLTVGPGQALCIPRGAIHRFDNNGGQDAKALCLITPAAIGPQYFRESAEVINAAAGGPPDRAKMAEIMIRHGLTPAPPRPPA